MTSKAVALREAKKIRSRGKNARVVEVSVGPGKKTFMVETSSRKKNR